MDVAKPVVSKRKGVFYGWWIVLAGAASMGLSSSASFQGLGTFLVPIRQQFGWSRGALTFAFSLVRLESGLLGPIEGWLIDRFGPRKVMYVGLTLMILGFLLLTQINSLLTFYLVFVVFLAIGSSFGSAVPIFTAVSNWFIRKRGLALGIVLAGSILSIPLLFLLAKGIEALGWRWSAVVVAGFVFLFGFPLASVMRHRPEDHGLLPDGDSPVSKLQPDGVAGISATTEVNFTPLEAIRAPAFWVITLTHAIGFGTLNALFANQQLHMVDLGLPLEQAALAVGLLAAPQAVSRIGLGWLGDRFSKKYIISACLFLMATGLYVDAYAVTFWQFVPFIVLYGIGDGGRGVLLNAIRADYFGRRSFATIQGISGLAQTVFTFSLPFVIGRMADVSGSYRLSFLFLVGLDIIAALLILTAVKPKHLGIRQH